MTIRSDWLDRWMNRARRPKPSVSLRPWRRNTPVRGRICAQFYLGALQYTSGKYERACETFSAFEDRLAQSPWTPNARLGHGQALLKRDRPDEAVRMFQAVAADSQLAVEARYWIALAEKAKKDWQDAAQTLLALADANPSHPLAPAMRFHAGDALLAAGDVPAAMQQFDAVLALPAGERSAAESVAPGSSKRCVEESRRSFRPRILPASIARRRNSPGVIPIAKPATTCGGSRPAR